MSLRKRDMLAWAQSHQEKKGRVSVTGSQGWNRLLGTLSFVEKIKSVNSLLRLEMLPATL